MSKQAHIAVVLISGVVLGSGCTASQTGFEALEAEYKKACSSWYDEQFGDKEADESGTIVIDHDAMAPHPGAKFTPRFKELALRHSGTAEELPALRWLIDNGTDGNYSEGDREWATHQMTTNHATDPNILEHIKGLGSRYAIHNENLVELFDAIVSQHSDRPTVARALFEKSRLFFYEKKFVRFDDQDQPVTDPEEKEEPTSTRFKMIPGPESRTRGALIYAQLIRDYGDLKVGERARRAMYEYENLQIGHKAPEVVGKDIDGQEVRLSQFAGQVVVLHFWGFW